MFKAASAGPQKAITANRLSDGLVVFLDANGGWSLAIADARLVSDGPELDEVIAYGKAQHDARIVVEPYAIDIAVDDGKPVPVRIRERIRAEGPTVPYGEAEYQKLNAGPG
jgi:sulfite reductase (NADPH) hemoprotein beta-component